jgi:predicted nucleotidyltransferase
VRSADPIPPLLGALRELEAFLRSERLRHVYIGGLAVALVGRPRLTRDIDAIIFLGELSVDELLRRAKARGFAKRIPDAAAFAHRTRVVLLRHAATRVDVDLSIGSLPFEDETVRRARRVTVKRLTIPVARPDDLIILKAIASRPRDIVDIEGLLDANPRMGRARIRSVTAAFAEILEAPELLENLERLLARRARSPHPPDSA